jgi:hypothetical protein
MFGPDWDAACPSCSSAADGISGLRQLHARNTTLAAVSRAPYPKLAAFRERMGWDFPWYSSFGSDFNYDFHATSTTGSSRSGCTSGARTSWPKPARRGPAAGGPRACAAALGRQEEWELPAGRATPLGRQVGGPGMRLPDEYGT